MTQAWAFALIASSSLIVGASVGVWRMPSAKVTASLLAFASGALTAAMSFELFEQAFTQGGRARSAIGLAAGAIVFIGVDVLLNRSANGKSSGMAGLALLAAVVLDGIPENLALGTTVATGAGSPALLIAIFASNFPEALVGAREMCKERDARSDSALLLGTWRQ